MFWGLIMEPHKRYTQNISKAFHISMASLDVSNSDDQPSQVLCGFEGRNYLLCTLHKSGILQCPLDLHFEEGTTVSFATNGNSHVHLTGYLTKELDELMDEESDGEQQGFEVKAQKKPRTGDDLQKQPSKKKSKISEEVEEEEDDSEDSDVDINKLMAMSDEEVSEEESEGEEEEDEAEDEEDDDDEEMEEEEDDEDVEEEEVSKVAGLLNGLDKKSKKGKKESQETPKKEKQSKDKPQPKVLTPGPKNKKQENGDVGKLAKTKEGKKTKENQTPTKKTLAGGLIIEDIRTGQGDAAANGKFVHVYYEGRLKSNNKVFDQTQKGPGFGFRLGKSEVIKGWDIGVAGMKVGGKRRITCPPQLAYGAKGSPPVIPPNATLVFEVELKKVK